MHRQTRAAAVLAVLAVTLSACAGAGSGAGPDPSAEAGPRSEAVETSSTDERIEIVVTTSILGDLVEQLVGDDATVEVLMEAGVDPHAFAPSARQGVTLREADLVVANGLGLEESLIDTLEAARADGVMVLEVAPLVDPIAYGEGAPDDHDHGDDHDGDEHGDEHGDEGDDHGDEHEGDDGHDDHADGLDPHVWFDPARMAIAMEAVASAVAEVDDLLPDTTWTDRGAVLADDLRGLAVEVGEVLATVPEDRRVLVTNHGALGYLAATYGFELVGTVVPGTSTQAETSAQAFGALAGVLRDRGVDVVFSEAAAPDRLARALAEEVGGDVQVVQLYGDALGPAGSGADTYRGLMLHDANRIAEALG
jgi:ABC-type Zn uptake system ZnuABC Zn-binding protein ZnuA